MTKYYYPQTYREAEEVLRFQPNDERSLRELVFRATRDVDLVSISDYTELRHQYHIISGIATRILKSKPKDL